MEIVFLFYDEMTALDAIGPYEILSRLPQATTKAVALKRGAVKTDSGVVLEAVAPFTDIFKADILVIPGAGSATCLRQFPEILEWVRAIHQTTTWTTSVCTGSLILGAAGLLKGVPATTHWSAIERLGFFGAIPTSSRVVQGGKIITAAGVSAGIDMALTLVAKIAGQPFAEGLQLGIEYDPAPPFDKGSPAKADPVIKKALFDLLSSRFESLS